MSAGTTIFHLPLGNTSWTFLTWEASAIADLMASRSALMICGRLNGGRTPSCVIVIQAITRKNQEM
jgi:hypothetical protein